MNADLSADVFFFSKNSFKIAAATSFSTACGVKIVNPATVMIFWKSQNLCQSCIVGLITNIYIC